MTLLHSIPSLDYGDGRTCVCRICECGKHPCPGLKMPFLGDTTYRDNYVPKKADQDRPRRRARDAVFPSKAEPGHFKTTNQEAAEPLDGKIVRPADSYKPRPELSAPLPFEGTTTNRADFPGHLPDPQRVRPKQKPLPKMKGIYDTTNGAMQEPIRDCLEKGGIPKPPKPFHADDGPRQELPFDALTSYTAHYPPKEVPQPIVRQKGLEIAQVPDNRDFGTTHETSYKAPPQHMRHICPAALVQERPTSVDGHIKLSVYDIPSGNFYN